MTEIEKQEEPTVEEKVTGTVPVELFNQLYRQNLANRKVEPKEFFIVAAHDTEADKYLAGIVRPSTDEEIEADPNMHFVPVVQLETRYPTAELARTEAARGFPTLPVHVEGDTFYYPFATEYLRKLKIMQQAEMRRRKKGLHHQPNPKKIHYGTKMEPCATCRKLLSRNDTRMLKANRNVKGDVLSYTTYCNAGCVPDKPVAPPIDEKE